MFGNPFVRIAAILVLAILAGGCPWTVDNPKRDLEREAEKDDGHGITLWSSEPTGLIHEDPYGSDVAAWYTRSYKLWQMDHDHLVLVVKKRNKLGIRNTLDAIRKEIAQMQRALAPEKQERLEEILGEYKRVAKLAGSSYIPSSIYIELKKLKNSMWDEFDPEVVELILPDASGEKGDTEKPSD